MELIDASRAIALLEEVVAEFGPDTTYGDIDTEWDGYDCLYVNNDGKPMCIVGQALAKAGFEFPIDPDYLEYANDAAYTYLTKFADEFVTEDAKDIFYRAQRVQDAGGMWGKALDEAKEVIR